MTVYLDASVVVSLLVRDTHTERARGLISTAERFLVSDLMVAEFSSAIAIRWRSNTLSRAEANGALLLFDAWRARGAQGVEILSEDLRAADHIIRSLDHALKAPDAIHIATARRLGAPIATFDLTMAREAERLGLEVIDA